MASISKQPNGRRTIQFVGPDKKRRSIRLGKMSQRQAEAVKLRVEHLVTAKITGHSIDDETARWLGTISDELYERLAKVELVKSKGSQLNTLGTFTESYIESRTSLKSRTLDRLRYTRKLMLEFFGKDVRLRDILQGHAEDFREWLIGRGLGENTVRRRCGRAKQFFGAALKHGLIKSNPFGGIVTTVGANPDRFHFVSREDANRILETCIDPEWRLLFALCRYGGLRCPSETLSLRWEHVDWEHQRITVPSPKTEHHAGRASRMIPLFPELRPHLERCFEQASDGAEFVITRYRSQNANLRTQLQRIIRSAGLEPREKPFQNLRSSRETELSAEFPMHVVCKWIGNSELVAAKHYLQVTDEHFQKAVQNPVQQVYADNGNEPQ